MNSATSAANVTEDQFPILGALLLRRVADSSNATQSDASFDNPIQVLPEPSLHRVRA
jgi:hypothetical protein